MWTALQHRERGRWSRRRILTLGDHFIGDVGMRKAVFPFILGLLVLLTLGMLPSSAAQATSLRTLHSAQLFLPPYLNPRDRFGFDAGHDPAGYAVAQLHAGWYSDWWTNLDPSHPDSLTYVQLIHLQAGADPYDPAQVTLSPDRGTIAEIAAAHPGSLWLVGNEPDSLYAGNPILPEVYAIVYHDCYTFLKEVDPRAQVANGGIVQPTPCRLEYLDIVWDTYQQVYGGSMPVDVWNIHAFILREVYGSWGASTPPGVDPGCGIDYRVRDGDNIDIFRQNLIAFRQWMRDKGQQHRPLIISEYGVLWPDWFADEDGRTFPPIRVSHFMTRTFDLFLGETYPDIGYPEDEYRLVQAWAWYSLSDDQYYNGYLFHSDSKDLSPMGQAYSDYTAALPDTPYIDLTVQLWADSGPLEHLIPTVPEEPLTATLPVTGAVATLGKVPATGVVVTSSLPELRTVRDVPARYDGEVDLLPSASLVITRPGVYDLSLAADPAQVVADVRRWNNAYTTTVDARPDLQVAGCGFRYELGSKVQNSESQQVGLSVALTLTNAGLWPALPSSGTLYLSTTHGSPILPPQRFSIPTLGHGAQMTAVMELTLPTLSEDFCLLALEVDSDGVLDEQDEGNNRSEVMVPIVVTTTLKPDVTGVLTSNSHHLAFLFPAGTVTRSTEIRLMPRASSELPAGPLVGVTAFELAAYWDGRPISLTFASPVMVTWQYTDPDVAGLDEGALGLYALVGELEGGGASTNGARMHKLMGGGVHGWGTNTRIDMGDVHEWGADARTAGVGRWRRVFCVAQQHWPEVNLLSTCLSQSGDYAFGQGYVGYLPLVLVTDGGDGPEMWRPALRGGQPPPRCWGRGEDMGVCYWGLPLCLPPWAVPPASR